MGSFGNFLRSRADELGAQKDESLITLLEKMTRVESAGGGSEITVTADSMEAAFRIAAETLGVEVGRLQYKIVESGSRGFFGMGVRPFKISFSLWQGKRRLSELEDELGADGVLRAASEEDKNADGKVLLEVTRKGAFLVVNPPRGRGKKAQIADAYRVLEEKKITGVEDAEIQLLLEKSDSKPWRVGDWKPNPMKDGKAFLEVSEDKLKAYVRIVGPKENGRLVDEEDIEQILREKRVVFGLDKERIKLAAASRVFNIPMQVAEGKPAKHGQDARFDYKIRIREKIDFSTVAEDAQIDFHEMNLIVNVMAEEVIAEKILHEKGEQGKNVHGIAIEARDGKDIELKAGENTYITEDGRYLKSSINGHAVMARGLVNIKPVYEVAGDVGPKTGHITNIGDVIIHGSVLDGFNVKAGGNIEIKGAVGNCIIEATGDVTIKAGMSGKGKGLVATRNGTLYAKYLQECRVEAAHDVFATEYILNSIVDCSGSVMLNGNKARLVGGRVRALVEISAKTLGSPAGVHTILEVGAPPQVRQAIEDIQLVINKAAEKLPGMNLDISTMEKQEMDEEKQARLEQLIEQRDEAKKELEESNEKMAELMQTLSTSEIKGKITALKNVCGNVVMACNTGRLENKRDQGASYYLVDENNPEYIKYHPMAKMSVGRRR